MDTLHFETEFVPARTIALTELYESYFAHKKNLGRQDRDNIKKAFELLFECFPNSDTASFSAASLLKYQEYLVEKKYARNYCNKLVMFVRSVFNWGLLYGLVSPTLAYSLKLVPPLRYGSARESKPREDVPVETVEAVLPFVSPTIADMLRLQILTAMRPSEVCRMTVGDINKNFDGENWLYLPSKHKGTWRGKKKAVLLGHEEQQILEKYVLIQEPESPVFKNSKRKAFTPDWYAEKVKMAIDGNNLPKFTPYQIRHTTITNVSKEYGRDVARAFAGHSSEAVTRIYDHSDLEKARQVIEGRKKRVVGSNVSTDLPTLKIFTGD